MFETVLLASTALWIALGAIVVLWSAAWVVGFLLLAMGKISMDLGWGRSFHELGPMTWEIAAPRDMVMEMISAPYLGRTPRDSGIEVLDRDERMVVAAHHTKVHFYTARTVEIVSFDPPELVAFRHLHGPVPHAEESFELRESGPGGTTTELRYAGELGIDFFIIGRLAGRHWVVPQWEDTVREHLDDLKKGAEEKARRRAAREGRRS